MDGQEQDYRSLKRTLHLVLNKVRRNREILRSFQQLELDLLSCDRLSDLLDCVLQAIPQRFGLDAVELLLFDPESAVQDLLGPADIQQLGPRLQFSRRYLPLKSLYPRIISPRLGELSEPLRLLAFREREDLQSVALLPLVRHDVIIGSLHLGSRDPHRYGKHVSSDYIEHLASIIAVCLENAINQERLRRLSFIDMLTQVSNRRAFDQELPKELARATRNGQPLSCLFLDLDHFKKINDTYGHPTGDRALRTVAQAIKQQLRHTDTLARFGGEEFAALLPNCTGEKAMEVAETVRQRIQSLHLHSEAGQVFRATLSVGVSTSPPLADPGVDYATLSHYLVDAADKAVYTAKRQGRNQVVFNPLPALHQATLSATNQARKTAHAS